MNGGNNDGSQSTSAHSTPSWDWFGLDPRELSPVEKTLLRCALFVGLFVLVWTFLDVRIYAGADLRNRIVGARVMLAGYDPYVFIWQPDMPEEWLDPVYDAKNHRLTLSPPGLLLYVPLAPLPYRLGRLVSFAAEWLALVVSLALLSCSFGENSVDSQDPGRVPAFSRMRLRVIFLLGATMFIVASDVWRVHVERGQVYVFYLLALSLAISFSRRGQVDSIAAGVVLGFLALMRPNLLMMAPAWLIGRQWRTAGGMIGTVAAGGALTFLVLPASSWQSYLKVGDQYYRAIQDRDSLPDLPRAQRDNLAAEGVNFGLAVQNIESSSFAELWNKLHQRFNVPMLDLALISKIIMLAIACVLFGLLFYRRGKEQASRLHHRKAAMWALIIVLSLDTEFFLPHRWAYADVMLLAPLALLLPEMLSPGRMQLQALGIVVIGLLAGCVGPQLFQEQPELLGPAGQTLPLYLATVLRSWLVMGGLTVLAAGKWIKPKE